jgi:hypothetical protein
MSTRGQNRSNYMDLNSYNTAFSLATAADLETQKVKSNAFQIEVVSRNNDQFNLYARVSSASSSTGTQMPATMLSVKLNSINPALNASYNTITLSNNDQLLQQITTPWLFWLLYYSTITLNYDLQLGPVGYDYPPGNYNFTVLFTMTQP